MQRPPASIPLRSYILFVALSVAIMTGYFFLVGRLQPLRQPPGQMAQAEKEAKAKEGEKGGEGKQPAVARVENAPPVKAEVAGPTQGPKGAKPPQKPLAKPAGPERKIGVAWVALGSADEASPYRMLVTFCNRGAALARIELSSRRYHDLDDRSGYLGHVVMEEEPRDDGAPVQVVGRGTPAAKAGLKPGDRITAVDDRPVRNGVELQKALRKTKPNRSVALTVVRQGKEMKLSAVLGWRPLEVVRPERRNPGDLKAGEPEPDALYPEKDCPLSLLATLQQLDDQRQSDEEKAEDALDSELPGVQLRNANWEMVASEPDRVVFRRTLPDRGVELTKTYRLAKTPEDKLSDSDFPSYHLEFDIQVKNVGDRPHKVACRLDGPNGLPREGWWYANKVSRTWGGAGLRDLIVKFDEGETQTVGCPVITDGKSPPPWRERLTFIGVDAQYFSAVMIPQGQSANDIFESMPLRVGDVDRDANGQVNRRNVTNVSLRLIGKPRELQPGEAIVDSYKLFAGPKKPPLLAGYKLGDVLYYGWFGWVAEPMLWTLHQFYWMVRNYGLAIVLLTVMVRLGMFPFSRKQALNAQKMQELQPEIKKIQEKHKTNMEARTKAQQELFRKHNYNPLSGCLVLFIQMPIFLGLYRSLMVDVELRDAPLITEAVRWCSNLAAPDMLYDWHLFMPDFINCGVGMFGLGPYFNILPVFTIVLFIVQQKMFMPPATDEQSAMQQKVMQYMMIFMGIMFYKVASGLCLYFIASSLWGLAERKFLPKTGAATATAAGPSNGPEKKRWPWSSSNEDEGKPRRRKKNRDRR